MRKGLKKGCRIAPMFAPTRETTTKATEAMKPMDAFDIRLYKLQNNDSAPQKTIKSKKGKPSFVRVINPITFETKMVPRRMANTQFTF